MSMVGRENRCANNPGDVVKEVVLGVDTHLDVHVAVALDGLGRRLGELAVPTTEKGYEALICWAEGFGRVRGAGVEGTSSPSADTCGARGSPTPETPRPPPARCLPGRPPVSPRAPMAAWR